MMLCKNLRHFQKYFSTSICGPYASVCTAFRRNRNTFGDNIQESKISWAPRCARDPLGVRMLLRFEWLSGSRVVPIFRGAPPLDDIGGSLRQKDAAAGHAPPLFFLIFVSFQRDFPLNVKRVCERLSSNQINWILPGQRLVWVGGGGGGIN